MNVRFFKSPSRIGLLFSGILLLLVSSNLNWPKDYWKGILRSDARGYYAWLPAVFIYGDLSFQFQETVENPQTDPRHRAVYRIPVGDKITNKYFVGTAVAEVPFFLLAHAITLATGGIPDGYSFWYAFFINLAGIFYTLAGLFFLRRLLLERGVSENVLTWTLLALLFGSNLFYYSILEPGMSHVYSFACVAAFLWYMHSWFHVPARKSLVGAALFMGLIILIRPVNGIIVLAIPLMAHSWDHFKTQIKVLLKPSMLLLPVCAGLLIVFIQPLLWKLQTGHFTVDSYPGEVFHFSNPHPIDFLFSYKKGALLYTPILLLSLVGYTLKLDSDRKLTIYAIVWGLLVLYVLSSWWNWWYGGSFSSRVLVEFLPFFALGLATLLGDFRSLVRKLSRALIVVLIVICQIQIYQYRYYQIHWEEMTSERYWNVFLRPDLK